MLISVFHFVCDQFGSKSILSVRWLDAVGIHPYLLVKNLQASLL